MIWSIVMAWLVGALVVGASGVMARAPLPPPAFALAITIVVLLTLRASSTVRRAVATLGLKPLVAFHLTRIAAGAYFLILYQRGVLPSEFAIAAGWSDIAVGLAAILVLWRCFPLRTARQRFGLRLWNTLGLIDIVGVLANGARLFVGDPAIGQPFTILPLALLPLFVVPIVLVSHLLLFAWSGERGK